MKSSQTDEGLVPWSVVQVCLVETPLRSYMYFPPVVQFYKRAKSIQPFIKWAMECRVRITR